MKRIISVCTAGGIFACAPAAQADSALSAEARPDSASSSHWTVRGHVPPEKFVIQSHRGAGELAPENTLEAFELGWKLGTIPESDLRTTKDGVVVAFHDGSFKRLVKGASPALQKKGVAEPKVYWQLLDLGVASFATDHPEVTLKAVRDYYATHREKRSAPLTP